MSDLDTEELSNVQFTQLLEEYLSHAWCEYHHLPKGAVWVTCLFHAGFAHTAVCGCSHCAPHFLDQGHKFPWSICTPQLLAPKNHLQEAQWYARRTLPTSLPPYHWTSSSFWWDTSVCIHSQHWDQRNPWVQNWNPRTWNVGHICHLPVDSCLSDTLIRPANGQMQKLPTETLGSNLRTTYMVTQTLQCHEIPPPNTLEAQTEDTAGHMSTVQMLRHADLLLSMHWIKHAAQRSTEDNQSSR